MAGVVEGVIARDACCNWQFLQWNEQVFSVAVLGTGFADSFVNCLNLKMRGIASLNALSAAGITFIDH